MIVCRSIRPAKAADSILNPLCATAANRVRSDRLLVHRHRFLSHDRAVLSIPHLDRSHLSLGPELGESLPFQSHRNGPRIAESQPQSAGIGESHGGAPGFSGRRRCLRLLRSVRPNFFKQVHRPSGITQNRPMRDV
jgi:hypothetical protein